MVHEVLLSYVSPFREAGFPEDNVEVFTVSDLRAQKLSPETEQASSDIFLLRHLFGPHTELGFEVNDGPDMTFKLDGSDAIWQLEQTLDIAERNDYQWAGYRSGHGYFIVPLSRSLNLYQFIMTGRNHGVPL